MLQGTDEVSASGSYSGVRFQDEQGLMTWEIMPHGTSLMADSEYPIDGIAEFSPQCSLTEVIEKVLENIAEVESSGDFQIRGLVGYQTSGIFGQFWYGGPYYGLTDPTTSQRCHASETVGGVVKGEGATIEFPENWARIQIHNKRIGTPEYDYALPPGKLTITEPGTIIRWWQMVNCNEFSANRDAAGSPSRRRAVALAVTGGYVRNWQSHFSSEWFEYTPAD
jgi:hypothetical protein